MQSVTRHSNETNVIIIIKTIFILLSVSVSIFEFFIPRIPLMPWLKIGLTNSITLLWIICFGFRDTIFFLFIRLWIISLYFGFSLITLILGFSGACASCLMMAVLWRLGGKYKIIGCIGISIGGAVAHNMTQLVIVYYMLAHNAYIFYQIPVMLGASIVFGTGIGILAPLIYSRIVPLMDSTHTAAHSCPEKNTQYSVKNSPMCWIFLFLSVFSIGINSIPLLIGICLLSIGVVLRVDKRVLYVLAYPFTRFWLLFILIGSVHLFFTPGRYVISNIPVTYEGVRLTLIQWLKLILWIESSLLFQKMLFHHYVFSKIKIRFPQFNSTIIAGMLAAHHFPRLIGIIQKKTWKLTVMFFSSPIGAFDVLLADIRTILMPQLYEKV